MVVDVTLWKEEGKPMGFRLIGGADFDIPLTCSRVVEGSIAEKAGLMEGDVVVRINQQPTINMTHEEAHLALLSAGSDFVLGVLRATSVLPEPEDDGQASTIQTENFSDSDMQKEQERIDKIIPDASVTDEEIAELLSGEAEVLKGHGVLGVNFKKMMPKVGVFKQSEVFQVLNDEQLKSKAEKEREEKYQWTTFLQKPQRPPPMRANQEVFKTSYKPLIVKQPKPKCAPDYREPTPEPPKSLIEEVQETEKNLDKNEDENIETTEERIEFECQSTCIESSETVAITTTTTTTTCEETITFEELAADATGEAVNEELAAEEVKSQEDEVSVLSSAFAEQLANVQTQLMALSHLPKTIQSTLDEITKQLQSLIPPTKLKQKSVECEIKTDTVETVEATKTVEEIKTHVEEVSQEVITEVVSEQQSVEETMEVKESTPDPENVAVHLTKDEIEEYEESQAKFRALWEKKREKQDPKDAKTELSAELKQKVVEERNIKQKKAKGFRGLQPQERPITLPGGRKWRSEKDAMNEEMIAEIISSQAELIMGSTLGSEYESPFLKFDERVNFLKYQKPEKDLSFLKNSETYRTIHHLTPVENGIEKRPAVVAAEADMLKCASPNPLNQNS